MIPISVNRRELICTYIAQRTEEILGKILKCCAWSNVLLGYPYFGVILPSAYVTLLPKSITTAIGMGVSEELGGNVPVTILVIVITGITGNIFAEKFLRLIKVREPIAKGIAIGSASHVIGTAKAMEMGQTEGAMSSLAIVTSGVLTVITASLFAQLA